MDGHLVITKLNSGRWIFPLMIEFTSSDIDDTIVIDGIPNKGSGVVFKLQNQFDYPANFTAQFTADSAPQFQVSPSSGTMEPRTTDSLGTEFKVSFVTNQILQQPIEGKLVITTEEMEWNYKVIGKHAIAQLLSPDVNKQNVKLNKK